MHNESDVLHATIINYPDTQAIFSRITAKSIRCRANARIFATILLHLPLVLAPSCSFCVCVGLARSPLDSTLDSRATELTEWLTKCMSVVYLCLALERSRPVGRRSSLCVGRSRVVCTPKRVRSRACAFVCVQHTHKSIATAVCYIYRELMLIWCGRNTHNTWIHAYIHPMYRRVHIFIHDYKGCRRTAAANSIRTYENHTILTFVSGCYK